MTKDNSINPPPAVNSTDSVDTINIATSDNLFYDEQPTPTHPYHRNNSESASNSANQILPISRKHTSYHPS